MSYKFKYLHSVADTCHYLDHRLCPEVRAMLCAMTSRIPVGGVKQRYMELCKSVDFEEELLTRYPLPAKVIDFFNKYVGQYGHSSIQELTCDPTVFLEKISWWTAWLLFDSPLVCGQEASTRALDFSSRGICREACDEFGAPLPELEKFHHECLEVFHAEVEAWKEEFKKPCPEPECKASEHLASIPKEMKICGETTQSDCQRIADALGATLCPTCNGTGMKHHKLISLDTQPFRPAFDRARWALPGTIATSVSFSSHMRERARTIRTAYNYAKVSGNYGFLTPYEELAEAYQKAAPGLAPLLNFTGADDEDETGPFYHLKQSTFSGCPTRPLAENPVVRLIPVQGSIADKYVKVRTKKQTYADPILNSAYRVSFNVECSLAVARDWHRHRTFYPFRINVVNASRTWSGIYAGPCNRLNSCYTPISDYGIRKAEDLFSKSSELCKKFLEEGDTYTAMLCLPLGTSVVLQANAGLRDFIYAMELRKYTAGANFEYQVQASKALKKLSRELELVQNQLDLNIDDEGE